MLTVDMIDLFKAYRGEVIAGAVSTILTESIIGYVARKKRLKKGFYCFSRIFLPDNAQFFSTIANFKSEVSDFLVRSLSGEYSFPPQDVKSIQEIVTRINSSLKRDEYNMTIGMEETDNFCIVEAVQDNHEKIYKIYDRLLRLNNPFLWMSYAIAGISRIPQARLTNHDLYLGKKYIIKNRHEEIESGCLIEDHPYELLLRKEDGSKIKIRKADIIEVKEE